ncbi:MAG: hypothetical protein GAK43_01423 [Stenotrophomonas maltophilia]|nr:MAG: hypothetical protein GAK43_01423 [Stenotrophomonas maltophilia]
MKPLTPLFDELRNELLHPAVRDLAWTLLSPPLLAPGAPALRHPLAASLWIAEPQRLAAWLRQHEHAPEALEQHLREHPWRRLGHYYEQLWQYALSQAPDVRLLAANLPVRTAQQTLGELDLLLEDDDGLHHLELAVKFYLGPQGTREERWLGPGGDDSLGGKLDHLYRHQLPLSASAEARAILRHYHRDAPEPGLWLGGYLFYPWPGGCPAPHGTDTGHLRGRWLRQRDWPAYRASTAPGWQLLPRWQWLAPAIGEPALDQPELLRIDEPRLLVRLAEQQAQWREQERIFLVADDWPSPPSSG